MKQQIQDLLHAAHFQPFTIHMNDGRNFEIKHPDFAYAGPNALTPVIVEVGRAQHMLNPRLIASIEHEAAES
jgi:hypothetical protein